MKRKRLLFAMFSTVSVLFIAYVTAMLRLCDAAYDIGAADFRFRFCGMTSEFIATIPTPHAKEPPRYSWRNLDGNKPTVHWVHFATSLPAPEVTDALLAFLRQSGFSPGETKDGCSWWNRSTWELCVRTELMGSDEGVKVSVTVNQGLVARTLTGTDSGFSEEDWSLTLSDSIRHSTQRSTSIPCVSPLALKPRERSGNRRAL